MVLRPDGAVWMPGPRRRLSTTALSVASSLVFGLAMIVVGLSRTTPLTFVVLLPAGAAWMVVIAGMNATNQASSPQWVHTRAASIFQIVLYTTFAVSGAIWGGSSRNG